MKIKDLKKQSGTDWERLSTMTDKEIDFSDNQELTEDFFAHATLRMPEAKKAVSLRIDPDVLEWYKTKGPWVSNKNKCSFENVYAGKERIKSTNTDQAPY